MHIAIDALHGAVIFRKDGDVVLYNKIAMSRHSYVDIVQACANLPPMSHLNIIAVFLEQMSRWPTALIRMRLIQFASSRGQS